jgi:hypothetical protein
MKDRVNINRRYQKYYYELKEKALGSVCIKCEICKTRNNLQLHHRYYAKNSIRPKVHREAGNKTLQRWKEAVSYPQRFQVLCLSCHNSVGKKGTKTKPIDISSLFVANLEVRAR